MTVKILVADDSVTMRKIFSMTFAGEDADVITVESGDAAIAKARELQPDVVLADGSLDGTDGYAVAQALKSAGGGQAPAVIVMASQHAPYDADRGRASGVDDHVLKPFDTQSLIDKVKTAIGKPRAAAQPGAAPVRPAAPAGRPAPPPAPPPPPAAARPPAPPTSFGASAPSHPVATGPKIGKATINYGPPQTAAARPSAPSMGSGPVAPRPSPAVSTPTPAPSAPAPKPAEPVRRKTMDLEPAARSVPPRTSTAPAEASNDLAARLADMGLSREQVDGVLKLTHDVIEQVVWEVVPDLAETLIREEIKRLTED